MSLVFIDVSVVLDQVSVTSECMSAAKIWDISTETIRQTSCFPKLDHMKLKTKRKISLDADATGT